MAFDIDGDGKIGPDNLQSEGLNNLTYFGETESISRAWAKQSNIEAFTDLQCYDKLPPEVAASLGLGGSKP